MRDESSDRDMPENRSFSAAEAYPPVAVDNLVPDFDSYLWIKQDKFRLSFCQDLSDDEALVMAVT